MIKNTIEENSPNKEVFKIIKQEINNHISYKRDKYDNESLILDGDLACGGTCYIKKYRNQTNDFAVAQKQPITKNVLTSSILSKEAYKTHIFGKYGARKRALRRLKKGYPLNIRLPAPLIYRTFESAFDMEYFKKGDLLKLNKSEKMLDEYNIFIQLAKIVMYLHQSGYVHRDIKPENIFIDDNYKLHLGDFDFAIKPEEYSTKEILGTRLYTDMKEALQKSGNRYKLDIYSTAVSLIAYYFENTFYIKTEDIKNSTLGACNKSESLKKLYFELAKKIEDKEFGKIIFNMLSGNYESMESVIYDFHKISTVSDKKNLKIILSDIPDINIREMILVKINFRRALHMKLNKTPRHNLLLTWNLKSNIKKTNNQITSLLTKNSKTNETILNEQRVKLIKRINNDEFSILKFIITEDDIQRQKIKLQSNYTQSMYLVNKSNLIRNL